jgi:hypothetical protein
LDGLAPAWPMGGALAGQSQIPVIKQAIETAALMLETDKSKEDIAWR